MAQPKVRRSLHSLQNEYDQGKRENKPELMKPLENVMKAWQGIKALPHNHPNSFFMLGGFHGEPFRGAGWGSSSWWGGYCNHGNVLFPTWHRAYLYKLEKALQSIPGCKDVMLPYWDETSTESLTNGIPHALTDEKFYFDGKLQDNPLRSFKFPQQITDNISADNGLYTKPAGYETVRYPLSGLVGTPDMAKKTAAHNKPWLENPAEATKALNSNVVSWLKGDVVFLPPPHTDPPTPPASQITGIHQEYVMCLDAPNYTVFSNTTSMQQWNDDHDPSGNLNTLTMALEQPHNDVHLSVGGFDAPNDPYTLPNPNFSPIDFANGDMGENDTAGLDPIFYFHHCNVDRMFWLWQMKWGHRDYLEIIDEYPGTNSTDNQGATPGIPGNAWLNIDTPLNPFKLEENGKERTFTSRDVCNIETQLGYTYEKGSLDEWTGKPTVTKEKALTLAKKASKPQKHLRVSGINRAPIMGSFVIYAYLVKDDKKHLVGTHAVLSRWAVRGCANCQTHLEVKAHFSLEHIPADLLDNAEYIIEIKSREQSRGTIASLLQNKKYKLELRDGDGKVTVK